LGAGEETTVDEECGRAGDPELGSSLVVRDDLGPELPRVETRVECLDVELEILGVLLEGGVVELTLVREDLVVVLPEFALDAGAARGLRGRLCLRMVR
jgi:hypothetical protein